MPGNEPIFTSPDHRQPPNSDRDNLHLNALYGGSIDTKAPYPRSKTNRALAIRKAQISDGRPGHKLPSLIGSSTGCRSGLALDAACYLPGLERCIMLGGRLCRRLHNLTATHACHSLPTKRVPLFRPALNATHRATKGARRQEWCRPQRRPLIRHQPPVHLPREAATPHLDRRSVRNLTRPYRCSTSRTNALLRGDNADRGPTPPGGELA